MKDRDRITAWMPGDDDSGARTEPDPRTGIAFVITNREWCRRQAERMAYVTVVEDQESGEVALYREVGQ
jgi:hypothetical protein